MVLPIHGARSLSRAGAFTAGASDADALWQNPAGLAHAAGVKLTWTHAREVFKDMTAAVPAWSSVTWVREARPLSLRFAGSRG
jgi:predicted molibdopterin-dependent oxidoreductase YjgC